MPLLGSSSPKRPDDPLIDEKLEQAQAAGIAPGSGAPATAGSAAQGPGADVPYVLPSDSIPLGRQVVGLTVDVQAPPVVNLFQETRLKVVVKNTSANDALGVVVRDELPQGLEFIDSQPPAQVAGGNILTWRLGSLPANSEKVLTVRVKPTVVGSFDHTATVVMMSGGRARTHVQEPKLKVEQTVKPKKILKGGQVAFGITVSNPGTGPARNVVIQAKLSSGLRHELGNHVEQTIEVLGPGEHRELDLVAEARGGGDQSCEVVARSPDVPRDSPEAHATQTITVTEPLLTLKLKGPTTRFTDTVAAYKVIVENPGTAAARGVRVSVTLPDGGILLPDTTESPYHRQHDRYKRRLLWTIPQLEPRASVVLSFSVRLGGIQLYQVAADARADGPVPLSASQTCSTDVTGMADVEFQVTEPRRVLDEGEETTFEIRIRNRGSKPAARVIVKAQLKNLTPRSADSGTEQKVSANPANGQVLFPLIDQLPPRGEMVLTITVKAERRGIGSCQVSLMHDDLGDSAITRTTAVRITSAAEPTVR